MVPATTTVAEWPGSDDQLGQSQVRVATQSLAGSGWGRSVDRIRHSDLQSGSNGDDRCGTVTSGARTHSSLQPDARPVPDLPFESRFSRRTRLSGNKLTVAADGTSLRRHETMPAHPHSYDAWVLFSWVRHSQDVERENGKNQGRARCQPSTSFCQRRGLARRGVRVKEAP